MVRVDECFQCGAKEKDISLIYQTDGHVLCKKCHDDSRKSTLL